MRGSQNFAGLNGRRSAEVVTIYDPKSTTVVKPECVSMAWRSFVRTEAGLVAASAHFG
jgi:hypothetical protein